MQRKTPQEKKALSYAKDRRNDYGENDKSSRKNIPLRKAKQNRVFRKNVNQILHEAKEISGSENLEILENKVLSVRKGNWKKSPDTALGEFLERKLEREKIREKRGKTTRKKIREIIQNLEIKIEKLNDKCWIAAATNLSKNISADGETPEKATGNLKYLVKVAVENTFGFDNKILINEKFIKPFL